MMIADKKRFGLGLFMLVTFFGVLVLLFVPIWNGGTENGLDEIDNLFNTVSKDSSNFNAEMEEKAKEEVGQKTSFVTGPIREADESNKDVRTAQALRIAELFKKVEGTTVSVDGTKVKVEGDLGTIMEAVVADSTLAFDNQQGALQKKYDYPADDARADEHVMYDWYMGIDNAQRDLTAKEQFEQSKTLVELSERSIEPAYNYYGIESESPKTEWLPLLLANIGYIIYTLWYGFALLFMFEGWGLKLEH